jgi:transposase
MQTIKTLITNKGNGVPDQQVADALKIAKGSVNKFWRRFRESGIAWPLPPGTADSTLRDIVHPPRPAAEPRADAPDWLVLEEELSRPGVTLQLLWEEYRESHPGGLGRSAYYEGYAAWRKGREVCMPIVHKGGEKLFVDYSGDGLEYVDRGTGEAVRVQVFVAAWGASGYAFADATGSQGQDDWVRSHVRAFDRFGRVPLALVPDNLKAGVVKPDLYEPELNPLYARMADHYGIAVLPARVRRPQDKAVVESCVLQVQRRVLAPLRDRTFFGLEEIRAALAEQVEAFNARPMKEHGGKSRRERFEALDIPHAKPLPGEAFAITAMKAGLLVQKNYHVLYGGCHYSVPHALVGRRVDIHQVGGTIEVYLDGEHVCRHPKRPANHGYETRDEHMPKEHAYAKGLSPSRLILEGGEVGPNTSSMVKAVLENRRHPEQGFKSAQGVIRLARIHGADRVEAACARALHFGCRDYRSVKTILDERLDAEPLPGDGDGSCELRLHANVRGGGYYSSHPAEGGL